MINDITVSTIEDKTEPVKDSNISESSDDSTMSVKDIRINNCLATADKTLLKDINSNLSKIDEFITNKKYIGVIDLLNDSKIVVASSDYLMFSFNDEANVSIFDSNINKVESLFKSAFGTSYKVVAVSTSEWNSIKEDYINKKKNNISYTILDENIVKLDKQPKKDKAASSASDIFGDDLVNLK